MFRLSLLILSFLLLAACGTTPEVTLYEPTARPDPKPIEAMAECDEMLSQLPPDFDTWPVQEAVRFLLSSHTRDATAYFECKTKQEDEARWINKQP